MAWPLASHFSAMLQNPRVAFRDPKLQGYTIERDPVSRQPRPWAGAFAIVYKAVGVNGQAPCAVRIFSSESPERRERYEQISEYLKTRKLKSLVDFEYCDRSIRSASDGKWYPLIVMEWVTGQTIFQWAQTQCSLGNGESMKKVAGQWLDVVNELKQANVAHGDFQQGNIMITDTGQLKLVDYDCMCVPSLVGRRNLEVGVEPYQHPGRNEHTPLSQDIDHFSALMIYVAFRALAVNPQLWLKYVTQQGYDKILFRKEDFASPATSPLYAELMESPDQEVRDLTAQLFACVRAPIDQIPPLAQLTSSFGKVEQLLKAKKWEDAVHALNRRGYFNDAPAELQPLIHYAYEYVCRKDAWEEYCRVPQKTGEENDRRLVDAWNETLFNGFEAAERQRVRVAEARKRVDLLDRLTYLIQQWAGKITMAGELDVVNAVSKLPQGYQFSLQARAAKALSRVTVIARIEKAIKNASSEAMIVAAWRAVVEESCEKALSPEWRARVELAEKRAPLLKELHDTRKLPEKKQNRQIVKLWDDTLLKDCREADRWREAYETGTGGKKPAKEAKSAKKKPVKKAEATDKKTAKKTTKKAKAANKETTKEAEVANKKTAKEKEPEAASEKTAKEADSLFECVREQQIEKYHERFDARLIRAEADRFEPFRPTLSEWTESRILPAGPLGIDPKQAKPSVAPADGPAGTYCVKWNWPDPRFTEQFILAVCKEKPGPGDSPQKVDTHMRLLLDRPTWDKDGGSRLIRTKVEWAEGYVVAWAVINLGFRALVSPPMIVGQLGDKSSWKWEGWKLLGKDVAEKSELPDETPKTEQAEEEPSKDGEG